MPNKVDKADFYRRGRYIIDAKDGKTVEYESENEAKKASRRMRKRGINVVVLQPQPQVRKLPR